MEDSKYQDWKVMFGVPVWGKNSTVLLIIWLVKMDVAFRLCDTKTWWGYTTNSSAVSWEESKWNIFAMWVDYDTSINLFLISLLT